VRDASQKEEVFILDLLRLPATVYNATLTSVFLSKKIIKLGQSFFGDLQELAQSYPHASCFTVCKGVVEVNDMSIVLAGAHNPLSLQKLVFFYLHRKLAKTQQMSNWERRPLTASQLHYAAADALVLLHLYDELLQRIQKQPKNFRLSDVTNVLDVNLPRTPKCSLCFEIFETPAQLKKHRKLCLEDVRMLVICDVCEGKKLVTEKVMEHHVKHCGVDEEADEPVVQVKRKRSLSVEPVVQAKRKRSMSVESRSSSVNSTPSSKKRRKQATESKAVEESTTVSGSNTQKGLSTSQRKRARLKKIKALEARKANADANDALAQRPQSEESREVSSSQTPKKLITKRPKKARRKMEKALAGLKATLEATGGLPRKPEASSARYQEHKKRKMSMESSLLTSDAMWSQISSDCDSTTAA
jgi:hypothetical protein